MQELWNAVLSFCYKGAFAFYAQTNCIAKINIMLVVQTHQQRAPPNATGAPPSAKHHNNWVLLCCASYQVQSTSIMGFTILLRYTVACHVQ